jgi:pyruvate dehydrogenase (quinone)
MCSAVPYAIAAKFAYPDRVVVATAGDGAMQMLGMNEMITIAKYYLQWTNPKLIIVVANNQDLNMVSWEQRALAAEPKFESSQNIPNFPFAEFANLIGLEGIRIDNAEDVEPAMIKAFAANKPVVIDAHTDANVPILPPHVSVSQAKGFFTALFKGDADAGDLIKQTWKEVKNNYFS